MTTVTRYHPLLVGLHWLLALAIIGNLAVGGLVLEEMANSDPAKPALLRLHMATGLAILALMVVRLVTRWRSRKPPPVDGARSLRWLATANHWGLYLLTFAMVSTGLGTAQLAGLFPILEGKSVPLPASFDVVPPFAGHVLFASLLLGLLALHVAAALWHAFVKRDGIFGRMWFGARTP